MARGTLARVSNAEGKIKGTTIRGVYEAGPHGAPVGFNIGGPVVNQIADFRSAVQDFEFAADAFLRSIEAEDFESNAMLRAALITYRRAFTTGRSLTGKTARARIPAAILDALPAEKAHAHAGIIDLANTYVAHQASDHQQARATIVLTNPAGPREVVNVFVMAIRGHRLDPTLLGSYADCASWLSSKLSSETDKLHAELLAEICAQPIDDLYTLAVDLGPASEPSNTAAETNSGTPDTMTR